MGGKLAPLALLGLALAVPYFIGYFSFANGTIPLVDQIFAKGQFPDGTPLRTHWFGVYKLDELISKLVIFFWPISAALHPALFLHTLAFAGTFAAGWTLVTLEAWRNGNAWTLSGL